MVIRALLEPLTRSQAGLRAVEALQAASGLRSPTDKDTLPYVFFRLASSFGEEIFSLMPALFWFGFPHIALPFSTNFVLVILTGQWLKDVIRLPRPEIVPLTKIIRLESHFETEFGMPSTHSTSGLMPFVVLLSMQRHYPALHASLPHWIYPLFGFLSVAVGVSRLYMGVHSVADVAVGLALGSAGVLALHWAGDSFDAFVYKTSAGIAVPLLSLVWFCFFYPKSRPWSAAWGTAAQIYGTWFGVAIGANLILTVPSLRWIAARLAHNSSRPASDWRAAVIVPELLVAAAVAGAARVLSKALAQGLALRLLATGRLRPHPAERKDVLGRPVPDVKLYCVEVPTRLVSYGVLALSVVVLTPAAWVALGL